MHACMNATRCKVQECVGVHDYMWAQVHVPTVCGEEKTVWGSTWQSQTRPGVPPGVAAQNCTGSSVSHAAWMWRKTPRPQWWKAGWQHMGCSSHRRWTLAPSTASHSMLKSGGCCVTRCRRESSIFLVACLTWADQGCNICREAFMLGTQGR